MVLDAKGQRRDVKQQNARDVARKDAALNGRAVATTSSGLTDMLGWLAGHGLHEVLDGGHAGRATTRMTSFYLRDLEVRVAQRLGDGCLAAVEKVARDTLELRARKGVVEVLGGRWRRQ